MIQVDQRTEDRCMGECCEEIGVEVSPEELEASYRHWLKGEVLCRAAEERKRATLWAEIWLIFPMLRFVRKGKHCEWEGYDEVYIYTCAHFDSVSRKCLIYEYRPEMCRIHGTRHACKNPKCRWKGAKRSVEKKVGVGE